VFNDEATFHANGKVNCHNVCVWGTENSHEIVEHEQDSPNASVFCAISKAVFGPFFQEAMVTG